MARLRYVLYRKKQVFPSRLLFDKHRQKIDTVLSEGVVINSFFIIK
jgi:hypothetical protein